METKIVMIATPMIDFNRTGQFTPNYGVYLLAGVLKNKGYHVVLIDLVAQGSLDITPYQADIENCTLVGIGGTSFAWPSVLDVIKQIRRIRSEVPIVSGGIHPTLFDRYLLERFPIQYIVRGEGEAALPSLCRHLSEKRDLTGVPNLSWIGNDGTIIRNPVGPGITGAELGALPLPDYEQLPFNAYHFLPIESSRGCVHNCSFCSIPYRRSWRFIAPDIFVDRLAAAMKYLDHTLSKQIQIVDDEFAIDPQRTMKIAEIIKERGLNPRLRYATRVTDVLVDGFVENLAPITGNIFLGAECGYDAGLKNARKGITCHLIESAARKLMEGALSQRATFSFIIGLPWETKAEVEKTVQFAFHLVNSYGVDIFLQWYTQIPGSDLWQTARNNQLFNESMYDDDYFSHSPYLFRSELKLEPKEIWEIDALIKQNKLISGQRYPNREQLIYSLPEVMTRYFPKALLDETGDGLANLLELSQSVSKISPPQPQPFGR